MSDELPGDALTAGSRPWFEKHGLCLPFPRHCLCYRPLCSSSILHERTPTFPVLTISGNVGIVLTLEILIKQINFKENTLIYFAFDFSRIAD